MSDTYTHYYYEGVQFAVDGGLDEFYEKYGSVDDAKDTSIYDARLDGYLDAAQGTDALLHLEKLHNSKAWE